MSGDRNGKSASARSNHVAPGLSTAGHVASEPLGPGVIEAKKLHQRSGGPKMLSSSAG